MGRQDSMTLVVLAIGIVILVASLRGTHASLFEAIGTDVPGFVVWAAAIVSLGAIGFIPGLKPVSRGLLALVVVVLIFQNYQNILAGFAEVATPPKTDDKKINTPGPNFGSGFPPGIFGAPSNEQH